MPDDETGPRVYDRDVLYREVWAEPVRTVAARYGVSDVALAKTCRRLQVPLPGRGYWSKQKAGTASPPPPLPKLREGVEPVIVIDDIWGRRAGVPLVAPKPATPTPRTVVPDTLRSPHPLVIGSGLVEDGRWYYEGTVGTGYCFSAGTAMETSFGPRIPGTGYGSAGLGTPYVGFLSFYVF